MIEAAWDERGRLRDPEVRRAVEEVIDALDRGMLRVAEPARRGGL
ncbi:MAG: hypothetical protein MZV63_64060 [Marinilabiliales bacterium]|nr:hypothetical protein [Marinilabiliales bacterium]